MKKAFIEGLTKNQKLFGLDLEEETIQRLAAYYEIVQKHNSLLHLTAPCAPEIFAARHVLESLALVEHLPAGTRFADVGTGAGLPGVPCLIAREDFSAFLIEAKAKKAVFLRQLLAELNLESRARIIDRQFEEVSLPPVSVVTSRALDKFTQKLPRLLKWSDGTRKIFYGGNSLRAELEKAGVAFGEKLLPLSEQRFIFIIE